MFPGGSEGSPLCWNWVGRVGVGSHSRGLDMFCCTRTATQDCSARFLVTGFFHESTPHTYGPHFKARTMKYDCFNTVFANA